MAAGNRVIRMSCIPSITAISTARPPATAASIAGEGHVATVDVFKADCEINWLVGCTDEEIELALATHRTGSQGAKRIRRGDTND